MRNPTLFFSLLLLLSSCKKNDTATSSYSEASYKITITGLWKSPQFSVPPGAHFTTFCGAVHNNSISLWKEGGLANAGIESVAETGNVFPLYMQIDSLIAQKRAISKLLIQPPVIDGTAEGSIYCNTNFSYFSIASMVAPSPDWFTGISDVNLYAKGTWVSDTTIQLFTYDAGTEEGDVFGYDNLATTPQDMVKRLTPAQAMVLANRNTTLGSIATLRLTKQ